MLPRSSRKCAGLAQGSEVEFADIVALNARTEIMYGLGSTECTSLGVLPEIAQAGHTMIGENWDWKALVAGRAAVLGLEQPGNPRVVVFTEAGFVGKIGLNDAGIEICANLLGSAHDKGQIGVPFHVILRSVLSAPNLHKAIQAVTLAQRGSSGNYLIGARGGEIIDIEATPEAFDVILPQDGIIAHSNHFLSPDLQRVDTHRAESTLTFIRHERARRLIARDRGQIRLKASCGYFATISAFRAQSVVMRIRRNPPLSERFRAPRSSWTWTMEKCWSRRARHANTNTGVIECAHETFLRPASACDRRRGRPWCRHRGAISCRRSRGRDCRFAARKPSPESRSD